jgi:hypothetical protein
MPKTTPKQRYDLRDSPFFNLKSRKKLAELLQTSTRTLAQLSVSSELYSRCWKHKLSDVWLKSAPPPIQTESYRPIDIPIPRLKKIQSRVANLLARIQTPNFLFSPVKGRSYVDNAAHHIGSNAFWLLDVADYFPSCSANNVARFFRRDLSCSPDVTAILVRLITLGGCLPQGSPCSPILAYYCNRPMWLAIECQTKTADCKLSLYADDITISGGIVPKKLIWEIKKIIHGSGLRLKQSKEASLINQPADITGVIVKNGRTHIPNRQLKKLAESKQELAITKNSRQRTQLKSQIAGRAAQRRQVERAYLHAHRVS